MQTLLERLRALLAAHPKVDKASVSVFFTEFGENALKISLSAYLYTPDGSHFNHEREALNLEIMQMVDELGLNLAFPARALYIEQVKKPVSARPEAPKQNN
jgi:MscS family membrane protein